MNNFKRVLRNTVFLTISEVFLKALGFLWIVYLAQTLTVSFFGRYNFVNSFISIFSVLPDLGIGLIVIREIAKQRQRANLMLGDSLFLQGFLALLTVIAITLATFLFGYPEEVSLLMVLASLTLFVSTIRSVAISYFDGTEKMHISAILNSLNTLLLIGVAFFAALAGFGLQGVFFGMLIGTLLSTVISWIFLLRASVVPKLAFDSARLLFLFREGLPLGLASLSFMVYAKVDSVMLGHLLGEEAVGVYSSATPFVFSAIALLNVPFVVALYPALSRLLQVSDERFVKASKKSFLFILLWSVPFAIAGFLAAPFAIPFVFGERYQAAVPILQILIFFVPFACLSALFYKLLIILNRQKTYLVVSLFGAFVNVLLNIFFIPKLGIGGAAISSVVTQVVLFITYFVFVKDVLLARRK